MYCLFFLITSDSTWTSAIASIFTLDTIHEITPDSSSNNVINIGALLPLTGVASSIGKPINSALDLLSRT